MTPTPLPDGDWSQRHKPISFRRLMHVKQIRPDVFESTSSGYPPTPIPRTYGGHVFAQAAYAAALTVPPGLVIHNISGWFTLLGDCRYAFIYRVTRTRDGGVYALRQVEVFQDLDGRGWEGKTPTFVCTVSLKRDETKGKGGKGRRLFEHQARPKNWVDKEYARVLKGKEIQDHALCQGMDGLWTDAMSLKAWVQRGDSFPGLEMRKVDMREYNGSMEEGGGVEGEGARQYRGLVFYRVVEDKEEVNGGGGVDDRNLDACAHLYASDRNSLFLAQRALGYQEVRGHQMGSLGHTVIFHGDDRHLRTVDDNGKQKWFIQEAWTGSSGADRVCHESRLWDYENGRVIATTLQDGMMRIPLQSGMKPIDGDAVVRKESKL